MARVWEAPGVVRVLVFGNRIDRTARKTGASNSGYRTPNHEGKYAVLSSFALVTDESSTTDSTAPGDAKEDIFVSYGDSVGCTGAFEKVCNRSLINGFYFVVTEKKAGYILNYISKKDDQRRRHPISIRRCSATRADCSQVSSSDVEHDPPGDLALLHL
eukprot:CAMPEP_0174895436 /NCGR_PEP_ID=MMETSP0167-20121228/9854_1 /TAXON_ID=38298 /ORGANISM="Rhodella maculata, Strain CCMP736" /LENGTH=158 /DNA_ID=CAMNT_0016134771 /DNA_START=26 /DNA_END=499 /DNA_ORIENTATION=+